MSLSTASIVRDSHMKARIYFIFLKNVKKLTWKCFITKVGPQCKEWKSICQIKQILTLFCTLIALILG